MTKNQKIVLGVGAVIVFFYVYMKNKWYKGFSAPTDPNNPRTSTKSNDANFSNFGNAIPCQRRFCPPKSPYLKYRKDGTCYCSETPQRTQTVSSTITQ